MLPINSTELNKILNKSNSIIEQECSSSSILTDNTETVYCGFFRCDYCNHKFYSTYSKNRNIVFCPKCILKDNFSYC
jgi:hypothetical protein